MNYCVGALVSTKEEFCRINITLLRLENKSKPEANEIRKMHNEALKLFDRIGGIEKITISDNRIICTLGDRNVVISIVYNFTFMVNG